ncbi:hypothetical protein O3G_MSEX008573 [Manduca sexta]|uniref:Reverse transcriptase domain-containing protein n=1 Tax=Manduca sexta TaxID=7130 RepID=A0A922CP67_MANSE|nr:hypothetical protein O3G_MSEX008573 [Manduca sexta]
MDIFEINSKSKLLPVSMANVKKKYLTLGLLNARSLNTGSEELLLSVEINSPDILAINESWIKPGEEALAPAIPNYRFLHRARQGMRGGGVGFYIRQGITSKVHQHPISLLEQLWLEVQLPNATLAVGTAYRPESVGVSDALDAISESIHSMARCNYTCILGDLNIDLSRSDSIKAQELINFCKQHNLEQLIKEPTRITDDSETILDVVMTDSIARCRHVHVIHNRCLSDHAMVLVDFDIKKPKLTKRVRSQRNLNDLDLELFRADLQLIPWESINTLDHVDEMLESFNIYLLTLFDVHAPIKNIVYKSKPKPWITSLIKFMMSLRDKAFLKASKDKTDSSKEYYKTLKNLVTSATEREKKAYFNSTINSMTHAPSILWRNIRNVVVSDNIHSNPIPDHLNDPDKINYHFLDLPPVNATCGSQTVKINNDKTNTYTEFNLALTTESEVLKVINSIKTKASGHDELNIDMIRLTLDATLPIITNIVNKSIETLTFPTCWKRALVRPIPKKSSIDSLKDLRPVSILPVLSKVLEKIVLDQVRKFVDLHNIIPKFQSGFRRGHGTETALLHITDDLTEASDRGLTSIMVLLDYSRAFDCLPAEILLHKLKNYNFSTEACKWFQTYLCGREQMVVTEGNDGQRKFSALKPLTRGVPQGSLLSPMLFTLFTADMPSCFKFCKYHLYADDTQLYYSFKGKNTIQAIEDVNADLARIYNWSTTNSLALNPAKSKMLVLGTKQQIKYVSVCTERIKINNVDIEQVASARNLGINIDAEQKYIEHVNMKIRSAFFKLKTLYKIRPYINEELRHTMTELLVLSHFNYCSSVYSRRINSYTEKAIQRVQNACIRFCYNIPKRDPITPVLNRKGILNMRSRMELQYAGLIHRIIWNKTPAYLFEKLTWYQQGSKHLRSASLNMIKIAPHTSARYRGCFKFAAASIWNDLPPPLRLKGSVGSFKNKYKSALLKKQLAAENVKHSYLKNLSLKPYLQAVVNKKRN